MMNKSLIILVMMTLFVNTINKCTYRVDDPKLIPVTLDDSNNQIFETPTLQNCLQYNGRSGCCNENNDSQQSGSYIEINSLFGFEGGQCDHCAINLKRFWCQYACSPNQADFLRVLDPAYEMIDPLNPSKNITVQKVQLTVYADTACDLYNSCKRNAFVTSVSAMGSPAGFIAFQGHNAIEQALQYIEVKFSYDKTKSLTFSDSFEEPWKKKLLSCDTKIPKSPDNETMVHGFPYHANCTCNSCEQACDNSSGFVYTESSVFEGFNWILVASTYLAVGVIAAILTLKRKRDEKNKDQ